jgi:hypothetical protein
MATITPRIYDLAPDTARELARVAPGPVLSIYVDLEPSRFATAPARAQQVRSLLDEAARRIRALELDHERDIALRRDLEDVAELLREGLPAAGARAVALFRARRATLFDVVRLPRPAPARVVVGDTPYVEPLVSAGPGADWCVLLVNRRVGRIFRGKADALTEVARVEHDVHGQHDQGGRSQRRYEQSIENEAFHHVRDTLEALFRRHRFEPFDHLLVGGPHELLGVVEAELHPYLRERLAGRIELDVEHATEATVTAAAAPRIEEVEAAAEREALARLRAGVARRDGRAASGLRAVLDALAQQRVGTLLLDDGRRAPGSWCPACGWVGAGDAGRCPADGNGTERRDDVTELMVERALGQSARVLVVRRHPDLGPHGGFGALLRF